IRSSIEDELHEAAKSDNAEIATRAQRLLEKSEPTPPRRPSGYFKLLSGQPQAPSPTAGRTAPGSFSQQPVLAEGRPLYYDGKMFGQWRMQLQTDLSPTRRTEAIKAIGEFAAHGYGK